MSDRDIKAGWYDDGHGGQRWFDGTEWTEQVVPHSPTPTAQRRDAHAVPAPARPLVIPPPPYVPPATAATSPAGQGGSELLDGTSPASADGAGDQATTEGAAPQRRSRRRRRAVALVVVLAVAAAGSAAAYAVAAPSGQDRQSRTPVGSQAPELGGSGPSTALADGDWTVVDYGFEPTPTGRLTGFAELAYTGEDTADGQASFTFTVRSRDGGIATAIGTVLDAEPGGSNTVPLVSTDAYLAGPYSAVTFVQDL